MSVTHSIIAALASGAAILAPPVAAQTAAPKAAVDPLPPYGMPIDGDQAQAAVKAAEAEARENGWRLSFAVVDPAGNLVMFKMMPGAGPLTSQISQRKARTAAWTRAPSKNLADAAARGSTFAQLVPDLIPLEGGIPIVVAGKVIGAIGASGAMAPQDAQAAARGAAAVR